MTALLVLAIIAALWGANRAGNGVADSLEAMGDPENVAPPDGPGVGVWLAMVFVVAVLAFAFFGAGAM